MPNYRTSPNENILLLLRLTRYRYLNVTDYELENYMFIQYVTHTKKRVIISNTYSSIVLVRNNCVYVTEFKQKKKHVSDKSTVKFLKLIASPVNC